MKTMPKKDAQSVLNKGIEKLLSNAQKLVTNNAKSNKEIQ